MKNIYILLQYELFFFSGQLNIKKSPHYLLVAHASDEQNNKQDDNFCRKKQMLPFEQMWYLEKQTKLSDTVAILQV